jgi:hypothetical protein
MRHKDNDEQIVLRISRELREQIEREAAASERTLAGHLRHILKRWTADEGRSEAA